MSNELYSTQIDNKKKRKGNNHIHLNHSENKTAHNKSEILMKYKKKSKEEIKRSNHFKITNDKAMQKKVQNGIKRKATVENIRKDNTFSKKSFENSNLIRHSKKNKMSEDTYLESKSSLTNVVKKKRTSLLRKKNWRREVQQQIENENMFKRSKEKKLDFSINESPLGSHVNHDSDKKELDKNNISQIRRELIQDDSEDELYYNSRKESITSSTFGKSGLLKGEGRIEALSTDSNHLQRIIEQRMQESSTDSEESEDELDDDYDIGIDDINLGTEDTDEIHTATEDEESNILNESSDSRHIDAVNYHKNRLKEALRKERDISPFADVIEKGLEGYMNYGQKRDIKLKSSIKRSPSKLKNTKLSNYENKK